VVLVVFDGELEQKAVTPKYTEFSKRGFLSFCTTKINGVPRLAAAEKQLCQRKKEFGWID